MFDWLKPKKPASLVDQIAQAIYEGNPPPPKSADLNTAISLAAQQLLVDFIDEQEVREVAGELFNGPMPYTTHTLALFTALNFYKRADRHDDLSVAQFQARMVALEWAKEKKIPVMVLQTFEDTLYKLYKP